MFIEVRGIRHAYVLSLPQAVHGILKEMNNFTKFDFYFLVKVFLQNLFALFFWDTRKGYQQSTRLGMNNG